MSDTTSTHALWILLLGMVLVLAAAFHASAHRLRLPSLVGYLVIGVVLRLIDDHWDVLMNGGRVAFGFLADLGIVVILFRVGLHSDLAALLAKLKPAALIWVGNVTLAGALGYVDCTLRFGIWARSRADHRRRPHRYQHRSFNSSLGKGWSAGLVEWSAYVGRCRA